MRAMCAAAVVGLTALTGCGSNAPTGPTAAGTTTPVAASTSTSTTATATTPTVALTINNPSSGSDVTHGPAIVAGTSTAGALVHESGGPSARVKRDGSWSLIAAIRAGSQTLAFNASKRGMLDASQSVDVTGTLSPAEQASKQAADEAQFRASTQSIPYAQLIKDSTPYIGNHVVFHGQVFQIQQSGNSGGILLLSVTDDGTGVWTDNVWVDYHQSLHAVTGDLITVYGTVTGTKSYDTQAGGATYVPQMDARYVDDVGSGGSGGSTTSTPGSLPPGTVTGKDAAGFNIGVHCSDDRSSPLPGCNDSPSYNPDGTRQQP